MREPQEEIECVLLNGNHDNDDGDGGNGQPRRGEVCLARLTRFAAASL